MNNNFKNLIKEFQDEGVSESEAEKLSYLAKNLANSVDIERSNDLKLKFLSKLPKYQDNRFFLRKHIFASMLAVILMLGTATFVGAQGSLPGQPLYTIKRVTEGVLGSINPSFKSDVLRTRSEEIKKISNNSSTQTLNKAVLDYENELKSAPAVSAEKLDESKKNLEDAVSNSSEPDKSILENAINETETKRLQMEQKDVKGLGAHDSKDLNDDNNGRDNGKR